MVSHSKRLYNNLVQMAMLASLLRFQPELGEVPPPPDTDLILGQSWAHTSARTVHAHLEHAAHHKNIDNVMERYQEELFEELHSLGRYQRPVPLPSHIQAYQLLGGEAETPPEPPAAPAGNSSRPNATDVSRLVSDEPPVSLFGPDPAPDLELELELGLERLEGELLQLPPPPGDGLDVWEMMDADLAEASVAEPAGRERRGSEGAEDFIQADVDMADEDADSLEALLRQGLELAAPSPAAVSSPEPLDSDGETLEPIKAAQQWESAGDEDQQLPQQDSPPEDWQEGGLQEEEEEEHYERALRHLWQCINTTETEEPAPRPSSAESSGRRRSSDIAEKLRHVSGDDSGQGSSAESEEPGEAEPGPPDEMTETARRRPRSTQGRLPFIRTMSMEQRWQDLASLLSLPAQEAGMSHAHQQMLAAHHPAYPYSAAYGPAAAHPDMARSVLLQNASLAPPPPPPPPPPAAAPAAAAAAASDLATNGSAGYSPSALGSVSHLGSAVVSSMNLTTDGLHAAAATSAATGEMMYYQNSSAAALASAAAEPPAPASGPAAPPDGGFLSQILGVDELQLMEMPMTDGHPEWPAGSGAAEDQFPAAGADYAKASQAHRLHEYGGYRAAAAAASPTVPGPPPDSRAATLPSAQLKKHQFFGKRYFQGADGPYGAAGPTAGGGALPPGSPSPAAPLKYPAYGAEGGLPAGPAYPPATPSSAEAAAGLDSPELKYSCSMDFMRGHPGDRMGLVAHNHSYHLPPQADGPSGVQRPISRDKHGDRPKEHLTRDEKRARSMSIPLSNEEIIHLPMDEFNERLSKHDLTEAQLSLIRDIRRRGKNKLAAQNCRKRKLDQILTLAEEVQRAKDQKQQTLADHQFLLQERSRIKDKYSQLYRHVFQSLRDPDGNPYSPLEYSLQQSADGSILLVPRNTTGGATVEPDPATGARRKQRDSQKPE